MDLDANSILLSLVVGSIGFVAFVYGKRMARLPHMIAGIVLMAYPYFVTNLLLSGGLAVLVLAALWLAVRLGW